MLWSMISRYLSSNIAGLRRLSVTVGLTPASHLHVSPLFGWFTLSAKNQFNWPISFRMCSTKHVYANRLIGSEKNVWVEFSKLASEPGIINLGQGFPDFHAPKHVTESLKEVAIGDNPSLHQYTRPFGHRRLVEVLAKVYSPDLARELDPMSEVLVTLGAYGSLFCAINGHVNAGDEVVIIEPYFDCYEPMVTSAGGVPVFVALRPAKTDQKCTSSDWLLDPAELESKFSERTKMIVLNTPNNPLGKVYTRSELEMIADLCKRYDVICLSDEVYEWITYDGNQHIKIASLPDMWERTITVGSAGKTFSVTGWKLGWSVAPSHLLYGPQLVHQNCVYTCPTPLQEAVAMSLETESSRRHTPECYLTCLARQLLPKRDHLASVLESVGMHPVIPDGGYFMLADISSIDADLSDFKDDQARDFKFVKWLIREKKLATIPPSAFFNREHKMIGERYIRFCFIKEDSTLVAAAAILRQCRGVNSTTSIG